MAAATAETMVADVGGVAPEGSLLMDEPLLEKADESTTHAVGSGSFTICLLGRHVQLPACGSRAAQLLYKAHADNRERGGSASGSLLERRLGRQRVKPIVSVLSVVSGLHRRRWSLKVQAGLDAAG